MVCCLHIYFRMISVPHGPLLSGGLFCGRLWPTPGLSICNSVRWPERAPSSQQQPKGSCKFLFDNHPSGFSPHLEDVGLSWYWVVDTIDYEANRGQGIDCKTWNIVPLERGREVGPGDPSCVWRLGVTLGHDTSPRNPVAWPR